MNDNSSTGINQDQFYKKIDFKQSFALYIHFPFCLRKCSYCDFYSEIYNEDLVKKYMLFLKKEIDIYAEFLENRQVKTIYLGGGTPSLMKADLANDLINYIEKKFSLKNEMEITLEANPYHLDSQQIQDFKKAGITRLSLGVQSLSNQELQLLGRLHSAKQAKKIIEKVGNDFDNYNIDLIFALPEQSVTEWLYTLEKIIDYNPPHLSIYNLQIESDTLLAEKVKKGKINPISEELDAEMYKTSKKLLINSGYKQYEISNFAKPGYESRHNLIYWKYQPYLGLGPAAHSFNGSNRFFNCDFLDDYFKKINKGKLAIEEVISLSKTDLIAEFIIMGLRLTEGISKKIFYNRFNLKIEEFYQNKISKLNQQGLLNITEDRIYLSELGMLLGNEVFQEFL